jgi:hypothetical protein
LAYQPPASSTFLSEQTSHQQPASSTFLSEQISISHQPNEQTGRPSGAGRASGRPRLSITIFSFSITFLLLFSEEMFISMYTTYI